MGLTTVLIIVLVLFGIYNLLTRRPRKQERDANGMTVDPRDEYYCYASYDAIDEGRREDDLPPEQETPEKKTLFRS